MTLSTASLGTLCVLKRTQTGHADWEPSGVVGWEANKSGKVAPRQVDLGPSMDPRRLAESAVSLNVSLMRWRAAPSLGIDLLQSKKMLLLGAGQSRSSPVTTQNCLHSRHLLA